MPSCSMSSTVLSACENNPLAGLSQSDLPASWGQWHRLKAAFYKQSAYLHTMTFDHTVDVARSLTYTGNDNL